MSKLFFAAALGCVALPTGASAQLRDVHVAYSDLDLSTPAGTNELNRRIARTVSTVCNERPHINVFRDSAIRQCVKLLTNDVEPQRQRVLALHASAAPRFASAK